MLTDDSTVSSALADLAATAGDRPISLGPIEVRARRMRHWRRAGRAGVIVTCVAALATGIGLAGAGEGHQSSLTAAGPPVVLPLCRTIAAQNTSAGTNSTPAVGEMFKALGTITGKPTADRITIVVGAPVNMTPQPLIFAVNRDTLFFDGGRPTATRNLRAGHKVAFAATETNPGEYRLDQIETNPDLAAKAASKRPTTAAVSAAGPKSGPPAIGQTVEGKGSVASALVPGAVSLTIGGGPLAGKTLLFTVTPATRFTSGGRPCDPSGLSVGTPTGFSATRTGTATYRLDELNMA